MTSENELKDAAYRVRRCERGEMLIVVYDTESLPVAKIAYRDDCEQLAIAYLARLAADEQQAERIATLERERDEARAAYCKLLDVAVRGGQGVTDEIRERFQDHPEWRKDGA